MKSLADPVCQREIATRIARLTPDDQRLWGKMSVHQMICHATEAYRIPLGDKQARPGKLRIPPAIVKFAALRIPTRWPHGFPSPAEIAQDRHGKAPVEFEQDRAALLAALQDFCTRLAEPAPPHPYFGPMSAADWNRWGYLHADHHLRQFAR